MTGAAVNTGNRDRSRNGSAVFQTCAGWMLSVSYTHLDVYKRQAYDNLHNGNRVNSGDLLLPHSGGRAYDAAGNSLRCLSGRNKEKKQ